MTLFSRQLALIIFSAIVSIPRLNAFQTNWEESEGSKARSRVLVDADQIGPHTEQIVVGFEFQIPQGWHLYWKNAREVGLAPKLDWTIPPTWSDSGLQFPLPIRIPILDHKSYSYGYENHVIFTVVARGKSDTKNFVASGSLSYLICDVQCIPESREFSITLPFNPNSRATSAQKSVLDSALRSLPQPTSEAVTKRISPTEIEVFFAPSLGGISDVFVARHSSSEIRRPLKAETQDIGSGRWKIILPEPNIGVEWTALGSNQQSSWKGEIEESISQAQGSILNEDSRLNESSGPLAFGLILLFAWLGGFILNLMPCVLPVVVLKTTSVLRLNQSPKAIKSSMMLTILGILTSFMILAAVTLGFQKFGHTVGWGFQFQNPQFLAFLVLVVFIFALNLFDLFDISISGKATTTFASTKSSFAEGVLATLLATPCSAPFLGTALTYALSQSGNTLLVMFFVMGLGLATPYILLLVYPQLLRGLPKPGPWMNYLKRILAYSLLLSGLWIFSIFQKVAAGAVIFVLMGLILLTFILFREMRARWAFSLILVLFSASAYYLPWNKSTAQESSAFVSIEKVKSDLKTDKRLFVLITADWCITCKFNEQTVIHTDWFTQILKDKNIELLIVDWTLRDPAIADFLKENGRIGIPFSGIFVPEKKAILPELLTRSIVEEYLAQF